MREITEEYIHDTIEKLLELKVDFDDSAHFSNRYSRYLKKFNKAKELMAYSNDVSSLFPLENPRELIYRYVGTLNKEERSFFLKQYDRYQLKDNIIWEFEDIEREEKWQPPKD